MNGLQVTWSPLVFPLLAAVALGLATGACEDGAGPATDGADAVVVGEDTGPAQVEPPPPVLRRLTEAQWRRALGDLLGPVVVVPAAPEPDTREAGLLSVGASITSISPRGVEISETAALDVVGQALDDPDARAALVPCSPADPAAADAACAEATLRRFGRRAWRRPLTDAEAGRFASVANDAADTLADFHGGLAYAMAGVLQSPFFLFVPERGEPDPALSDAPDAVDILRLTGWELAARLALALWDGLPDDALLDAAASGDLLTDAGLSLQVDRMLASPRAAHGVRAFFGDLLHLDELERLTKDPTVHVHYSPEIGHDARDETLRTIEAVVFSGVPAEADIRTILTTPRTFVNRRLASLYNVQAPAREGFSELVRDGRERRVGILGQVSFLALHSHPIDSSATLRGKFVRQALLCQNIPMPPAELNPAIPEPRPDIPTLKDRLVEHRTDPVCAACHEMTDPIGFAFETFDAMGRWRSSENGALIDPTGQLDGEPFDDAAGLAAVIAEDPRFARCLVRRTWQRAVGRREVVGESDALVALDGAFEAHGYQYLELLRAMVTSPAFRLVGAAPASEEGTP